MSTTLCNLQLFLQNEILLELCYKTPPKEKKPPNLLLLLLHTNYAAHTHTDTLKNYYLLKRYNSYLVLIS